MTDWVRCPCPIEAFGAKFEVISPGKPARVIGWECQLCKNPSFPSSERTRWSGKIPREVLDVYLLLSSQDEALAVKRAVEYKAEHYDG